jgi:hypothetical protein
MQKGDQFDEMAADGVPLLYLLRTFGRLFHCLYDTIGKT